MVSDVIETVEPPAYGDVLDAIVPSAAIVANGPEGRSADVWVIVPATTKANGWAGLFSRSASRYANVMLIDDGSRDDTKAVAEHHPVWFSATLSTWDKGPPCKRASFAPG